MKLPLILAGTMFACAGPVLAASSDAVPQPAPSAAAFASRPDLPVMLTEAQRVAYRAAFEAIRAAAWSDAAAVLDTTPPGPLHAIARAELYLAKGSPKVELDPLLSLITAAPELPQAIRLSALAGKRGGLFLPPLPVARDMISMRGSPRRLSALPNASDPVALSLAAQVRPLIKDDKPAEAEALLAAVSDQLAPEARAEWQQRIGWSYYLTGDDASAWRLGAMASAGTGTWTVQGDWVAGLAAWRLDQCAEAGAMFSRVASYARDDETRAAGLFWAARADMACGHPERVQARLRTASRIPETFYGLLAARTLGTAPPAPTPRAGFAPADWSSLSRQRNVATAVALVEIGERGFADELLRHQARIGPDGDHAALLHLAARLDLPATQIWLAHNCASGVRPDATARYPSPGWTPVGGWRVDRSLIYAHALQESLFRTDAVSLAGARGLMQVLPTTADLIAKRRGGLPVDRATLSDPAVNMDFGQAYLEQLRDFSATGGLLPKVIAAYNAGPASVQKWNVAVRDRGDPLLWIESIPFYETRAYVALVLRNYWMYQQQAGQRTASLTAMAQRQWPRFPSANDTSRPLARAD